MVSCRRDRKKTTRRGLKMFGEKSSGRCLVFSFEWGEDGAVTALRDSSSECPIFMD